MHRHIDSVRKKIKIKYNKMSGYPIQIVSLNTETKQLDFNYEKLKEVLMNDDVKDTKIAVISISGASRKGRSFLLNFLLKYLENNDNNSDWLNDVNAPLTGFPWSQGSQVNTKGIWIWSKIFIKTQMNGEKIGILLMDSQGTFDGRSSMSENIAIFSISMMLSSIHLYNLIDNVTDENLERLEDFIEYGKIYNEKTGEKALDHFIFLVRDWAFSYESSFGFEGGMKNLNEILTVNVNEMEDYEIMIRNYIRITFNKLESYLMPNPGRTAITSPNFTGQIKEIDAQFEQNLKILIPNILSTNNLYVKKINGEPIKASEILTYFQFYWEIFGKGKRPTSNTILKATSYGYLHNLVGRTVENFKFQMNNQTESSKPYKQFSEFIKMYEDIMQSSIATSFNSKLQLGDEELHSDYREKLNAILCKYFYHYCKINDLKNPPSNSVQQAKGYTPQNDTQKKLIENLLNEPAGSDGMNEPQSETSSTVPVSQRDKFQQQLNNARDSFKAEARRAEKNVKNVAQRVEQEAKNVGKDIEREVKNAAQGVKDAVKKIRWKF